MNIETLIVTVNNRDVASLLIEMNVQTDALVGNQCEENIIEEFELNEKHIKFFSFNERGVGLNRNNLLMRSDADICILADDDMCFNDGYESIVLNWVNKIPQADILIFNLEEENSSRYRIKKIKRVNRFNFGRYGAARLVIKRKKVWLNNIFFNLLFGGGAKYSCGEDTLFLKDCLNKKLKIYAVPDALANIKKKRESTWFQGYNDKYFYDKGILYYLLSKKFCKILSLCHCIKHNRKYREYGIKNAYKKMIEGIKNIKYEEKNINS